MTSSRPLAAVGLAALLVAACAGGSDDAVPAATDPPSTTELAAPPTSEAAAPTSTAAPATTAPASTDPVVDDASSDAIAYSELALVDGPDSDLTLALSEFAFLFGVELDGAVPLLNDDTVPTLATHAVTTLEQRRDELTDAQRDVIDATNEAILNESTLVYSSANDEAYQALIAEADGEGATTTEPVGFRSARPHGMAAAGVVRLIDEDLADDIATATSVELFRRLGGPELDWELRVAPPSEAERPSVNASTYLTTGGCRVVIFDRPSLTGSVLKSVVAHEVFHCWQATSNDGAPMVDYYLEGLATWVGEELAGGSDFGNRWWLRFFEDEPFDLYRMEYPAVGFWGQVAQMRGGSDALWAIIPRLNANAGNADAVWNVALDDVDDDLTATLAATGALRPDWSASWNLSAAPIGDGRAVGRTDLAPGTPESNFAAAGVQALDEYDFGSLPDDTSWVVNVRTTGLAHARWSTGEEITTTSDTSEQYCYGGTCECANGNVPFPSISFVPAGATSLTIGLTGPANATSSSGITASDIEDFCDEEVDDPDLDGGQPSSLVGTWRANPDSIAQMFELAASAGGADGPALEVAGVSGDLLMTLEAGGSGTLVYDDIKIFINHELLGELSLTGGGTFQWDTSEGQLRVQGGEFAISGSTASLGPLFTLTDADVGGSGTSTFGIGPAVGTQLVLLGGEGNRGEVFFPLLWTRQ